jgi:hypothetical protein
MKSRFQMAFEFYHPILGLIISNIEQGCTYPLWAIDICSKIKNLIQEYLDKLAQH